jgi:hypothetical protein
LSAHRRVSGISGMSGRVSILRRTNAALGHTHRVNAIWSGLTRGIGWGVTAMAAAFGVGLLGVWFVDGRVWYTFWLFLAAGVVFLLKPLACRGLQCSSAPVSASSGSTFG